MFVKQGGFLECEEISSDGRDRLLSNMEAQFEDKCYSSKRFIDEFREVKDCFLFFLHTAVHSSYLAHVMWSDPDDGLQLRR